MRDVLITATKQPEARQMVSPKVAAEMLGGIDRDTVFRWIKAGKLKATKPSPRIVLVYVSSIDALLEAGAL